MKTRFLFSLIFSLVFMSCSTLGGLTEHKVPQLEFVEIKQLHDKELKEYDLSGIVSWKKKVLVQSDNSSDRSIDEIIWDEKGWSKKPFITLKTNVPLDMEGIDSCGDQFYLINEKGNRLYQVSLSGEVRDLNINFDTKALPVADWSKNAGFEGLAVNCAQQIAYVFKERDPRALFTVDLNQKKVIEVGNLPETFGTQYSDAKFEKGFLYVLERDAFMVTKYNPITKKIVDQRSFSQISSLDIGKLYGPTLFAMEEALLMTNDEIWIGVDNNGLEVTHAAEQKYGIKGSLPILMKFKRPKGF